MWVYSFVSFSLCSFNRLVFSSLLNRKKNKYNMSCCYGSVCLCSVFRSLLIRTTTHNLTGKIKEMNNEHKVGVYQPFNNSSVWAMDTITQSKMEKRAKAMKLRNYCVIYGRRNSLSSHSFTFVISNAISNSKLLLYVISIKWLLSVDHFIL